VVDPLEEGRDPGEGPMTLEGSGDPGEDCGVLEGRGTYKGALGDLGR
jgi:hypothetical protein